jgi:hypothetical protein
MSLNWKAYIVLFGVFVLSIGAAVYIPDMREMLRAAVAAPGITALLAALFQLMRDEATFEKQLEAQRREFQFAMGSTSHMANVAFDKHVEFCEKYVAELNSAVRTLYREGESERALTHAQALYAIREQYFVWLSSRIDSELDTFESALRKLGADAIFIATTTGHEGYAAQRLLRIERNFELFSRILGLESNEGIQEESMIGALKSKVREILVVEELTWLREHLIKQASSTVKS